MEKENNQQPSVISPVRSDKIKLQNAVFGTTENKLMTSDRFLDLMAKKYVSTHIKVVNENITALQATKSPKKFFGYIDNVYSHIDALIEIEPVFRFNNPVPSVYKKAIKEREANYISHMIDRVWKYTISTYPLDEVPLSNQSKEHYSQIIKELLSFSDRLSDTDLKMIDEMTQKVNEAESTPPAETPEADQQ